jgi:NAD(P)-dependent dehydrogenase (short-subunit alcohol dehydrogenase family)
LLTDAKRLEGKTALVTGAGKGLGLAIAKLLAEHGATVVVVALHEDSLGQWQEVDGAVPIQADRTKGDDVDRLIEAAFEKVGHLDIVCNVAGVNDLCYPLHDTSDDLWDSVLDLDLTAPFRICRKVIGSMIERGSGVILNVASYAAMRGNHGPSYTAAKAGLVGLTRSIAVAYGGKGIRCNVINPGGIENTGIETGSGGRYHEEGMAMFMDIAGKLPVNWVCQPEDVAPVALFLCSDDAHHVNGAVVAVDGGMSAC